MGQTRGSKKSAGPEAVSRKDVLEMAKRGADVSPLTSTASKPILNYPADYIGGKSAQINRSIQDLSAVHAEHGVETPVSGSDLAKMRGKRLNTNIAGTLSVVPDLARNSNRVVDHRVDGTWNNAESFFWNHTNKLSQ